MRIGDNPTKFMRRYPGIGKVDVLIPQPLTVTTITYVPNLIGYYEQALDILKFTFAAFLKKVNMNLS